jgi:superfamily II DNA/RNA helicase
MNNRRSTSGRNFGGNRSNGRSNFRKRGNFGRQKPNINITAFIKKAQSTQPSSPEEIVVDRSFKDFYLDKQLQINIEKLGFTQPTPIQDKVIDSISQGKDVVGIANTGTGKTGAFLIPLIDRLTKDPNKKVLIVAPTRELAGQINSAFIDLAKDMRLYSVECIGGTNIHRQMQNLRRNFHMLIGTPGRIIDLTKRRALDLSQFEVVVLDEVDRMLDMGFVNDIRKILGQTSGERQSLYFSATIQDRVSRLIREFSREVETFSAKTNETADLVMQEVIKYQYDEKKLDMLHDVLISEEVSKVLIFGRTKHGVKKLMFQLRDRGFRTDSIHGNKSQSQRQRALSAFKENQVNILVATDVAARGLDIDDVTHVINYEIPDTFDDYVHRIGRTGRGGKRGVAYTFVK